MTNSTYFLRYFNWTWTMSKISPILLQMSWKRTEDDGWRAGRSLPAWLPARHPVVVQCTVKYSVPELTGTDWPDLLASGHERLTECMRPLRGSATHGVSRPKISSRWPIPGPKNPRYMNVKRWTLLWKIHFYVSVFWSKGFWIRIWSPFFTNRTWDGIQYLKPIKLKSGRDFLGFYSVFYRRLMFQYPALETGNPQRNSINGFYSLFVYSTAIPFMKILIR